MKKTTKKSVAATKETAKPVAKAAVKAAKAAPKAAAAPAKKKTGELPATFISAQIDIGFGNQLFVRGTGPGLSWDQGVPMECVGTGLWTVAIKNAILPVTFKVLVNDLSWSAGEDYVVSPGHSLTITPSF